MVRRDLGILEANRLAQSGRCSLQVKSVVGSLRMKLSRHATLRSRATVTGVGIHSGLPVNLTLGPAPVDAGLIFVRAGSDGCDREVQATAEAVISTEFATVLGDRDGPIVPIMDGSAAAFVAAIEQAGTVTQPARRRFIQVLKPVQVAIGDSYGELRPYAAGFRVDVEIDFTNPVIGGQSFTLDLSPESFRREISRARTFGCMNDVARLWSAGFALGASFENSVVFDETRLLNTEGLRYTDECARHKVLDVIGDLALAGLPLLGAYRSMRGGHKLNHAVLTALMADRSAWRVIEAETARRPRGHAEAGSGMVGGMIAPAYGPDVS